MTNTERVLRFLEQHPSESFDDGELSALLGIRPRQQMNQICNSLAKTGKIKRRRLEGGMRNSIDSTIPQSGAGAPPSLPPPDQAWGGGRESRSFEEVARRVMSEHFGVSLAPGRVLGTPKTFDLVSSEGSVVGDAKFYSMVRGERQPPAKRSVIAEYVWLLEHVRAEHRFLVFGNDRRGPKDG